LWVDGPYADVSVRELRLADDPTIYVYPVEAWDRASHDASTAADLRAFWAAGLTLAAWFAQSASLDPRDWEVLVPPRAVLGTRPVADERVLASIPLTDWTHDTLAQELKRARRGRH
jgi:hypothetical protein